MKLKLKSGPIFALVLLISLAGFKCQEIAYELRVRDLEKLKFVANRGLPIVSTISFPKGHQYPIVRQISEEERNTRLAWESENWMVFFDIFGKLNLIEKESRGSVFSESSTNILVLDYTGENNKVALLLQSEQDVKVKLVSSVRNSSEETVDSQHKIETLERSLDTNQEPLGPRCNSVLKSSLKFLTSSQTNQIQQLSSLIVGIQCDSGIFQWHYLQVESGKLTVVNQGVIDLGQFGLEKLEWVLGNNLDQGTNLFFEDLTVAALRGSNFELNQPQKNKRENVDNSDGESSYLMYSSLGQFSVLVKISDEKKLELKLFRSPQCTADFELDLNQLLKREVVQRVKPPQLLDNELVVSGTLKSGKVFLLLFSLDPPVGSFSEQKEYQGYYIRWAQIFNAEDLNQGDLAVFNVDSKNCLVISTFGRIVEIPYGFPYSLKIEASQFQSPGQLTDLNGETYLVDTVPSEQKLVGSLNVSAYSAPEKIELEYDHRFISNLRIGQKFLNIGDKNCYLLVPNGLVEQRTTPVFCTSSLDKNRILLFSPQKSTNSENQFLDAFKEFLIPQSLQSHLYTVVMVERLLGISLYQQGYNLHVQYLEYPSFRIGQAWDDPKKFSIILDDLALPKSVDFKPFCYSENIPDLVIVCALGKNLAIEFAIQKVDEISLKFTRLIFTEILHQSSYWSTLPLSQEEKHAQTTTTTSTPAPAVLQPEATSNGVQTWVFMLIGSVLVLFFILLALRLFGRSENESNLKKITKLTNQSVKKEQVGVVSFGPGGEMISENDNFRLGRGMEGLAQNFQEVQFTTRDEAWLRDQWNQNPNFGYGQFGQREYWASNREEENWMTRPQFAQNRQLSMMEGNLARWNNGYIEQVTKKDFIQNPEMNLVEFMPDRFDPHFQPEVQIPFNRVAVHSPYRLERNQRPSYFPYAYGSTTIVTKSKPNSDEIVINQY